MRGYTERRGSGGARARPHRALHIKIRSCACIRSTADREVPVRGHMEHRISRRAEVFVRSHMDHRGSAGARARAYGAPHIKNGRGARARAYGSPRIGRCPCAGIWSTAYQKGIVCGHTARRGTGGALARAYGAPIYAADGHVLAGGHMESRTYKRARLQAHITPPNTTRSCEAIRNPYIKMSAYLCNGRFHLFQLICDSR